MKLPLLSFFLLTIGCGGVALSDGNATSGGGASQGASNPNGNGGTTKSAAAAQKACSAPEGALSTPQSVQDYADHFVRHRWFRCEGHPFSLEDDGIELVLEGSPYDIDGFRVEYGGRYYLLKLDANGNLVRRPGLQNSGKWGVGANGIYRWWLRFAADSGENTYDIGPSFTTGDDHMVWTNGSGVGLNRYVPFD
jgi:hypothetical protein